MRSASGDQKQEGETMPEDEPTLDEIEAIREAKADTGETVPHNAINWD